MQSMAGIVRENLAEINVRIANGVRVAYIHAEFLNKGMVGNLWSFRKAITRARKLALSVRVVATAAPEAMRKEALPEALTTANPMTEGGQEELDKYFVRKSIFNKGRT